MARRLRPDATLEDVAHVAGVSLATVDRVVVFQCLHDGGEMELVAGVRSIIVRVAATSS